MSLAADVGNQWKRLFGTPGGRKVLQGLEREADENERRIARRKECVAAIAESQRRGKEDVPKLEAVAAEQLVAQRAAREQFEQADRALYQAGTAAASLRGQLYEDKRRAECELRRTCDTRLLEVEEHLRDARANWDRIWDRLAKRALVGEFMECRTVVLNKGELEALQRELVAANDAIDTFKLIADPTEDQVAAVIARARAALAALGQPIPEEVVR